MIQRIAEAVDLVERAGALGGPEEAVAVVVSNRLVEQPEEISFLDHEQLFLIFRPIEQVIFDTLYCIFQLYIYIIYVVGWSISLHH